MMEALVVLASMLRRVRFLTVPGEKFPAADPRITLRPASCTLLLEMHPRTQYQAAPEVELLGSRTGITMTNHC